MFSISNLLFSLLNPSFNIVKFLSELDVLIENSNPEIKIFTGTKNVNYNHLNKYINTVFDSNITEGFKIVYRGRVYDYSI